MRMIVLVASAGLDDVEDDIVGLTIQVENEYFRGTYRFYDSYLCFRSFGKQLMQFPSEIKDPVLFDTDGVSLTVRLLDDAGRIAMDVHIHDDATELRFSDSTLEANQILSLGRMFCNSDFALPGTYGWDSDSVYKGIPTP
jgi:hypothetical protein